MYLLCADAGISKMSTKKWLPVGLGFRQLIGDIKRVWPGYGRQGLQLLQVGLTVPICDINEPHIPTTIHSGADNAR